jgi:N6-adenosine-specific RNA methylase IME4
MEDTEFVIIDNIGDIRDIKPLIPLPNQTYSVILADPPWQFKVRSAKGEGRSASNHYDCMDFDAVAGLPVCDLAQDDCTLFLWVTDPMLPKGLELIEAWGFKYKTVGFYWVKLNASERHACDYFTGLGYWTRANPEQCLLATRGSPRRRAMDVQRLVVAPRREHSRKPDCVREHIERLLPGPYIELFARDQRTGWDCWGKETTILSEPPIELTGDPIIWA